MLRRDRMTPRKGVGGIFFDQFMLTMTQTYHGKETTKSPLCSRPGSILESPTNAVVKLANRASADIEVFKGHMVELKYYLGGDIVLGSK